MTKVRKILLITLRSDIGGGSKHVYDLLSNSKKSYFVAAPNNQFFSQSFEELSKNFLPIPFRSFSLLTFFRLVYFVKKNSIDIVHSHGRGAGLYSRLLKLFGLKVIHTFHGIHIELGPVGKLKILLDRYLKGLTDNFICVSESEFQRAKKYNLCSEPKTRVINNGVEIFKFKKREIKNKKVIIGSLSRLNYAKGIDILIQNLSRFIKRNDLDFEVHIAGEGEERDFLEGLIKENKCSHLVKLIGATTKPKDFLDIIDIYINASRFEGLPLSVLEAMSNSIPCILSNVVGNNSIAPDDSYGALFELDDYQSFEKKFYKILTDASFREKVSKNAHNRVASEFSLAVMIAKTSEVYE